MCDKTKAAAYSLTPKFKLLVFAFLGIPSLIKERTRTWLCGNTCVNAVVNYCYGPSLFPDCIKCIFFCIDHSPSVSLFLLLCLSGCTFPRGCQEWWGSKRGSDVGDKRSPQKSPEIKQIDVGGRTKTISLHTLLSSNTPTKRLILLLDEKFSFFFFFEETKKLLAFFSGPFLRLPLKNQSCTKHRKMRH